MNCLFHRKETESEAPLAVHMAPPYLVSVFFFPFPLQLPCNGITSRHHHRAKLGLNSGPWACTSTLCIELSL